MIKIEKIQICGIEPAIRGMRNPMNSWEKSDSKSCQDMRRCRECTLESPAKCLSMSERGRNKTIIGPHDRDLMIKLAKNGASHAKYRRMIIVYMDIIAPLYWWKEYDTYKVGTVANSCSTMHKIQAKEFTREDFSLEHLSEHNLNLMDMIIQNLNIYREKYLASKDKEDWWQMIQILPSSYNQRRTVMLNYEVLHNIYRDRINHKLDEWRDFCWVVKNLLYSDVIIT